MIIDAHMHIWRKIDGIVNGGVKVTPRGNGMITIGKALMLGVPATHLDCSARAEWVVFLARLHLDASRLDAIK